MNYAPCWSGRAFCFQLPSESNAKKLEDASSALWRKIIEFQAVGDLAGFLRFGTEVVDQIPDEADKMIIEAGKDQPRVFIERHL